MQGPKDPDGTIPYREFQFNSITLTPWSVPLKLNSVKFNFNLLQSNGLVHLDRCKTHGIHHICILILHFSISLESRKWKKKLIYSSSFCLFVRYYNFLLLFLLLFVIFKWNMSKFLKNEIYFYVFSFSYFQVELPRMTANSRDKALMMLIYFYIFIVKKVYAFLTIFKIWTI